MTKQNKISISILIVFFFMYLFVVYATYTKNKSYLFEVTRNNQFQLVHAYKEKFDERLLALKRIVEAMGKDLVRKDRFKEFDNIKETLHTAITAGSGFTSVYISYPDNFTISGRSDWFYSDDYIATKRPWYLEAVAKGKTTITKPYVGSPGFNGVIYISIVSPLYKGKKLLAVIASDLELDSLQKELSTLFPLKEGFAFLMTKEGEVITRSNKLGIDFNDAKLKTFLAKLSQNKSGYETFHYKQHSYIFTHETLKNSDWLFVSVLDKTSMYKKLDHQLMMNLLAAFVLLILGIFSSAFIYITQKKLYEKHFLLGLFSKSPTWAILFTDKKGYILFVNKSFERIFSIKRKSINGKFLDVILPYLNIDNANCDWQSCFKNIQENPHKIISYNFKKNDKYYRVLITPLLKYQKEVEGIMVTVNNTTNEKNLEKKEQEQEQILIQNSKMAALGEMVSAISHQWKQPLSTLLMLVSSAEDMLEKKNLTKASNYLSRSRTSIELMNETIQAFRNFYKEDFGKKRFDLVRVIEEVLLISTPQMNMNGIALRFIHKQDETYICVGYPSYIKQVLINLLSNSKDELAALLKKDPFYEAKIQIDLFQNHDNYLVGIEDNGRGIEQSNHQKIFEPFFTTKGEFGTGMGLHLCKLLTESKMNGALTLACAKNPTRFLICIGKEDA